MLNRTYSTINTLVERIVTWRERHLTQQQFVLILAFVTGLAGAAMALTLKWLIHLFQHLLTMYFVRYLVRDDIGHGVTKILYAISQRKSIIKVHNMYTSVLASSVTIGFGGSVGAEAPIVLTGSAIGSNLGRLFRMDQHTLMILLGCGATAGTAGIFKAPIAGLLFTIEVLMLDLTAFSIMPLLISAVTAASVAYFVEGPRALFYFTETMDFSIERAPYVILLGICCGFASLYFTRTTFWAEDFFKRFHNPWQKWIMGGLFLSIVIFLFPPLYGEGYDAIQNIYNGQYHSITEGSVFYDLDKMPVISSLPNSSFWVNRSPRQPPTEAVVAAVRSHPHSSWVTSQASSLPTCSTKQESSPPYRNRTSP